MENLIEFIQTELQAIVQASGRHHEQVAHRIADEVQRICTESQRIQASGEIPEWHVRLARHRIEQCRRYYTLGSRQGRIELQSILSSIVYRYITPPQVRSSYQARINLIEDFLQGFYVETLNAFRRENQLSGQYRPRTLLELAEYMAFSERYAKRRIPLPGRRSQQLIILRAQTFAQQQPPELSVDLEQAAEGSSLDSDQHWQAASTYRIREQATVLPLNLSETALRARVVRELMAYLRERKQDDCADYFRLRLQDCSAQDIELHMNLSPRQRDYLQQRFKYHVMRFTLLHHWELVHQWLEADLERDLGLTPEEWQCFHTRLETSQQRLLQLKKNGLGDREILQVLGCTRTQLQRQWSKLLEQAWEIRNRPLSGAGMTSDE